MPDPPDSTYQVLGLWVCAITPHLAHSLTLSVAIFKTQKSMLYISESSTAVEMIQKHLLRKSLSTYFLSGLFINQGSHRRLFFDNFILSLQGGSYL